MSTLDEILSNLPEEGIDIGDPESWTEPSEFPPPPPGDTYNMNLSKVRDVKVNVWGGLKVIELTADFSIVGGDYDGRLIPFIRVNSYKRKGEDQSQLLDLFKSAGVDDDELNDIKREGAKKAAELAFAISDQKALFRGVVDWEAFSVEAFRSKLQELTDEATYEDAAAIATKEQKKEANTFGMVLKGYRKFPDAANGSGKLSRVKGPLGETVEARAVIRVFKPVE